MRKTILKIILCPVILMERLILCAAAFVTSLAGSVIGLSADKQQTVGRRSGAVDRFQGNIPPDLERSERIGKSHLAAKGHDGQYIRSYRLFFRIIFHIIIFTPLAAFSNKFSSRLYKSAFSKRPKSSFAFIITRATIFEWSAKISINASCFRISASIIAHCMRKSKEVFPKILSHFRALASSGVEKRIL
mgnify:CR=1 FL=1